MTPAVYAGVERIFLARLYFCCTLLQKKSSNSKYADLKTGILSENADTLAELIT